MNPLLYLLGQQAAPEAAQEATSEIVVPMNRKPAVSSRDADVCTRLLGNPPAIEATEQAVRKGQEVSDRRGLFGMKGTLRDVIGLVGDAFLVQSGNAPVYAPRRRQEQISGAMAGFTEDPLAASERTAYFDPALGRELYHDYEDNLVKKAQAESLAASRQSQIQDRDFKQYKNAREQIGALFNTPGAVVDGKINPKALQLAERIAGSANMTLEDFLINEGMTEEEVRQYARSVIDPYKQERLEDYDIGLAQGERNAASRETSARASMIRAQRPPAGRAPQQPTEAAELSRIRGKVNRGEQLSPGDAATWEKYTRPPSSGAKSGKKSFPGAANNKITVNGRTFTVK